MTLERVREEVEKGASFPEAVAKVKSTTAFTTHTPVPAGHDVFPVDLVDKYFREFWTQLGIDRRTFLGLGQYEGSDGAVFNMTILALKMSDRRNAVSELHGRVTRKMWHGLWPELKEEDVPIVGITNGIHLPTWIAPELYQLCAKHLSEDITRKCDDLSLWDNILNIPDEELWNVRKELKRKLIHIILESAQNKWARTEANAQQVLALGTLLDQDSLTIGFVRRFTEYKRPSLIFHDIARLKKIINDKSRPVQFIFAGKSHPADFPSKHILHQVFSLASDREFQGRIAFVEDYDLHLARYLVQGVDVWLNTPRRLQEACGTSGMKASINGVLHLSVRDGWWHEGYNGKNGWAIGDLTVRPEEEDAHDAESLYNLLEQQIVPLFYDRDRNNIPHGWVRMIKEAIRSIAPNFCAKRMLTQYTEQLYIPVCQISNTENKETKP
jgi:starch phosphorylase